MQCNLSKVSECNVSYVAGAPYSFRCLNRAGSFSKANAFHLQFVPHNLDRLNTVMVQDAVDWFRIVALQGVMFAHAAGAGTYGLVVCAVVVGGDVVAEFE